MQKDLNVIITGEPMNCVERFAQLLVLLATAMVLAPGFPVVIPLCSLFFAVSFYTDKFLLCRYYQKPLPFDAQIPNLILRILPYFTVVRLLVACTMLGESRTLQVGSSNLDYKRFLIIFRKKGIISDCFLRTHTFPLLVFILIIGTCIMLENVWVTFSLYSRIQFKKLVRRLFRKEKEKIPEGEAITSWELHVLNDPLRRQSAPFKGCFSKFVKNEKDIPDFNHYNKIEEFLSRLTPAEVKEGFKLLIEENIIVKAKVWPAMQLKLDGSYSLPGERKKTYEVIADYGCYTYDLKKIPSYSLLFKDLTGIKNDEKDVKKDNLDMEIPSKPKYKSSSSKYALVPTNECLYLSESNNTEREKELKLLPTAKNEEFNEDFPFSDLKVKPIPHSLGLVKTRSVHVSNDQNFVSAHLQNDDEEDFDVDYEEIYRSLSNDLLKSKY
jgi:hypothetical protein